MRISYLVRLVRKKPERRNKPTNLTLDPQIKEQAVLLATALGYSSLSELVAKLLSDEISRAGFERAAATRDEKALRQLLEVHQKSRKAKGGGLKQ